MGNSPILVFGLPRSGTTWIGKLFDSHPDVVYRHEPDSWIHIDGVPLFPSPDDPEFRQHARHYLEQVVPMCSTATCGKRPLFPKRYRSPLAQRLYKGSLALALLLEKTGIGIKPPILAAGTGPSARLTWKSIESVGRLALFLAADRQACGVHIVRHPCGYISSVIRGESEQKFRDNNPSSDDWGIFEKLLLTDTARSYGLGMKYLKGLEPVQRLAWRWLIYNEHTYRENLQNPRYRLLLYEDVCDSPVETMKEVFAFCNLPWDPQTEAFITRSSRRSRAGYYSIYRDPKEASAKWRKELDEGQVSLIREIVEQGETGRMYSGRW